MMLWRVSSIVNNSFFAEINGGHRHRSNLGGDHPPNLETVNQMSGFANSRTACVFHGEQTVRRSALERSGDSHRIQLDEDSSSE